MRIDFSTEITTANRFKINKDNEEEQGFLEIEKVEQEEFKELNLGDLTQLKNWVHLPPAILKQGMTKHGEIENDDEDLKKRLTAELLQDDPYETRLKSISQDKCRLNFDSGGGLSACWIIKTHGDMLRKMHTYKPTLVESTYLSIRSLIWPGFIHIVSPVIYF